MARPLKSICFYLLLSWGLYSQQQASSPQPVQEPGLISLDLRLNGEIRGIYQELSRFSRILKMKDNPVIPGSTTFQFIGKYPNRTGFRFAKYNIEEDTLHKGEILRSEEKSITIEFNGSALSKIEVGVKIETPAKTVKTRVTDNTPLDNDIDDIIIKSNNLGEEVEFPLSSLSQGKGDDTRAHFKRDFYVKFLRDFTTQLGFLEELQKIKSNDEKSKNLLKVVNSLQY
jgi:hypothetical protein